jgi:hypothetical protein
MIEQVTAEARVFRKTRVSRIRMFLNAGNRVVELEFAVLDSQWNSPLPCYAYNHAIGPHLNRYYLHSRPL